MTDYTGETYVLWLFSAKGWGLLPPRPTLKQGTGRIFGMVA